MGHNIITARTFPTDESGRFQSEPAEVAHAIAAEFGLTRDQTRQIIQAYAIHDEKCRAEYNASKQEAVDEDRVRAAFEKCCKPAALDLTGTKNDWTRRWCYVHSHVDAMWSGWKAAYLHPTPKQIDAPQVSGEVVERVAKAIALQQYHEYGLETLVSRNAADYADDDWESFVGIAKAALAALQQASITDKPAQVVGAEN